MSGSPELLEFYLVEATEYIDALDYVVGAGDAAPDGNSLLATARALRGSSTMAKVEQIATLSECLEEIAVGLDASRLPWTPELGQSLAGSVTDLRLLVRGVRVWSDREQQRVDARLKDLRRYLGAPAEVVPAPTPESTTPVFVALQGAAIAAELDAFVSTPTHRRSLDDAIGRTRTLRGIAGIADYPPLADVAEAVERVGRRLMPDAPLSDEEASLFRAAAALFRRAADELRNGAERLAPGAESERFAMALAALDAPRSATPPVVRIEQLFYQDKGPHVVDRAPQPPVTVEARLHQELVARADHLRRLVTEGRSAADPVVAARIRRELRTATREVDTLAASFGAHLLAAFFAESQDVEDPLSAIELRALGTAADVLAQPFGSLEELERRIVSITRQVTPIALPAQAAPLPPVVEARAQTPVSAQPVAELVVAPSPAPVAPPPAPVQQVAAPMRRPSATPTGRDLKELLRSGIEGFRTLDEEPLIAPTDVNASEIVPIEDLLFRGPAALSRAVELRDAWRARGKPEADDLREIFDLLDLARSE